MAQTHSLDLESGSSQYASITDASQTGLDITGDITFEMWAKFESLPSSGNRFTLIAKDAAYFHEYRNIGGTLTFQLAYTDSAFGTSLTVITLEHTLSTGVWYHIACAADVSAQTANYYINGQELAGSTGTADDTTINNSAADFVIGARDDASNPVDGLIKDVRVFSDIRTQTEIVDDAHTENVSDANLEGEWNFNNAYTDSSGNGNTLTASNSPVFSTDIPWDAPNDVANDTSLSTNLVSYWKLDELTGNTRIDSHGSNDLTDNNTVADATGIINQGADFESTNSEYLSITDASQSGLDFTSDFSASFWVKLETSPSTNTQYDIFQKWGTASNNAYIFEYVDNAGTKQFQMWTSSDGSSTSNAALNATLTAGTFHHIAMVYDASAGSTDVYQDGAHIGTITGLDTSIFNGTSDFRMGSNGGTEDHLDGILDEFSVYSSTLTYGDILDLYNNGNALQYSANGGDHRRPPGITGTGAFMIV